MKTKENELVAKGCKPITMLYKKYKEFYEDCEVEKTSYNKEDKTIIVFESPEHRLRCAVNERYELDDNLKKFLEDNFDELIKKEPNKAKEELDNMYEIECSYCIDCLKEDLVTVSINNKSWLKGIYSENWVEERIREKILSAIFHYLDEVIARSRIFDLTERFIKPKRRTKSNYENTSTNKAKNN